MFRKLIISVSFIMLLIIASSVRAEPFSLGAVADIEIGNDPQIGPDSRTNGTGFGMRDIPDRRRVALISYDISGLLGPGALFSDVSFSHFSHDQDDEVSVYGVLEDLDLLDVETLTWNTAPGVKNDPAPPLNDPVVLDFDDLTGVLMTFTPTSQVGVRFSTDTSQALADFLNSDTDGIVMFLMSASAVNTQAILRSSEHSSGGTLLEGNIVIPLHLASKPNPDHEAVDVACDVVLSWTPGRYADSHNVYFGTVFDDVNAASTDNPMGVLASQNLRDNTYDPAGLLEFSQTYYWRVDEVNAPPDSTIYKGQIWSFTVEPIAHQISGGNITATASSSSSADTGPEKTIDGSGLNTNDQHSAVATDMWLSSLTGPQPTWIKYEFDKAYKLHEMWVWNSNQSLESFVGLGMKNVTIECSLDDSSWTQLDDVTEFNQATGLDNYTYNTVVDFNGAAAKYVRITVNSNWGGMLAQYGLSEVRFFYIPVRARLPQPSSGGTGVALDAVLSWRAGRDAASHDVYFSDSNQAVIDGTAAVTTVTEASYSPLSLDLDKTYYWRVDEVNVAEIPSFWEGEVWNFTTQQYLVVDDFEAYDDLCNRIFYAWVDGFGHSGDPECGVAPYGGNSTGSTVGNYSAPFAEQTIVHEGGQSMPLGYNNSLAPYYSETQHAWTTPQDWTKGGASSLTVWFYGQTGNTLEGFYVAVEDSARNIKVVGHSQPAAIQTASWQQWDIPLTSFAGVNMSSVKKMYIGVGDRTAPQPGGAGTLYIDDIRLYPPQPTE